VGQFHCTYHTPARATVVLQGYYSHKWNKVAQVSKVLDMTAGHTYTERASAVCQANPRSTMRMRTYLYFRSFRTPVFVFAGPTLASRFFCV
jgi:hypothetical protein